MGKKALLVVSFGTSYKETREKTIDIIEKELSEMVTDYDFKRAFTSGMIINKMKKRDKMHINNVKEAMVELKEAGYEEVVVQPTHILNGDEYEKMVRFIEPHKGKFRSIKIGAPMLTSSKDYSDTVDAIMKEVGKLKDDEALVLMGHGTGHFSDAAYAALDYRFKFKGHRGVFVGTVEGFPELDDMLHLIRDYNPKKIKLMPFMIVAGDHATNDMAGDDEDSWKSILEKNGYDVEIIFKGLGELDGIRNIFKNHLKDII